MRAAVHALKASADYQRISRLGKKWVLPAFIMLATPRDSEDLPFRFGLTASRKVGGAVVRNRAKRRLRQIVRLSLPAGEGAGHDVVLIARTAAATRDFTQMQQEFLTGLRKLGILR